MRTMVLEFSWCEIVADFVGFFGDFVFIPNLKSFGPYIRSVVDRQLKTSFGLEQDLRLPNPSPFSLLA